MPGQSRLPETQAGDLHRRTGKGIPGKGLLGGKVRSHLNNIIIHINTVKGKGFRPAELDPLTYHGLVNQKETIGNWTFSKQAGKSLANIATEDTKIVAVTAAMLNSVGLFKFSQLYPNRVFDVGICEEHAVTMSAGMTALGLKPYVCIYSTFLQRAADQIIHDICIDDLPVTFMVDRAGLVCDDGQTHQGIYDVAFFNPLVLKLSYLAKH